MGLEDPLWGGKLLKQAWRKVKSAQLSPPLNSSSFAGLTRESPTYLGRDGRIKSGHDGGQSIHLLDVR
jgi:hypothetical protein